LFVDIKRYIAGNIEKILGIMQEAWEIIFKYGVMARRIHTLSEYLQ
jgi:hypothetical protein